MLKMITSNHIEKAKNMKRSQFQKVENHDLTGQTRNLFSKSRTEYLFC